mmetsp:Transcript_10418/g.15654  ORF Transcript_10418/g.15654 Transcript_10418/m.15654 type:complete len:100 (+) Transcript_10418:3696-3995(+)
MGSSIAILFPDFVCCHFPPTIFCTTCGVNPSVPIASGLTVAQGGVMVDKDLRWFGAAAFLRSVVKQLPLIDRVIVMLISPQMIFTNELRSLDASEVLSQ